MAEKGCKTPGQMLFYMNKAAKELYGKEDMKAFIESEKASNKTPEEKANSLYAIHIEAEASCEAIANQLKQMEQEKHPMLHLLTKKSEDVKNAGEDFFAELNEKVSSMPSMSDFKSEVESAKNSMKEKVGVMGNDVKEKMGVMGNNVKDRMSAMGKKFTNMGFGTGGKTKKNKGKKNSSKKNKPKK